MKPVNDPLNASREHDSDRKFFSELYWFLTLGLLACIIALVVLPPRASESLSLIQRERLLHAQIEAKKHQVRVFEKAIESVENDPVYREAVFRERLGVKKPGEVYLDQDPDER